ncbi:MAG: N-acetylmuramoyl-L-alanine amidase [Microgenomates group bacterium]
MAKTSKFARNWVCQRLVALVLWTFCAIGPAAADDLTALAKLDASRSTIALDGGDLDITLGLSQPVPWRVRVFDNPPRTVIDFREVDFSGLANVEIPNSTVVGLRAGNFRAGWSRLVIELANPMLVTFAEMQTRDAVGVSIHLRPATAEAFAIEANKPEPAEWALPENVSLDAAPKDPSAPLIVVLDPGHGGIDPGAENGSTTEAALVLKFAKELREVLLRSGRYKVILTREVDEFVSLEGRLSIVRAAGASVFISLHADALAEGEAVGATIYTLADEASDAASAALAERHNRDDLLSGIDLTEQDDVVAKVLLDMARTSTTPRTKRLSKALKDAIISAQIEMHHQPEQTAGFSVLKSADTPSVLVELGFLSSDVDLARLLDDSWRQKFATAMLQGLDNWSVDQAALLPIE